MRGLALFAWLLPGLALGAGALRVEAGGTVFQIDPATLAVRAGPAPDALAPVVAPAFAAGEVGGEPATGTWTVETEAGAFTVTASGDGDLLDVSIAAAQVGRLSWPHSTGGATAYALPIFGEGKYVPADDAGWVRFLADRADRHDAEGLSLPIVTELRGGGSMTWIADPPFDTQLVLTESDGRLATALEHTFDRLDPDATYRVRFWAGPEDPVAGARRYRALLEREGRFVSLKDKARANPDVARLAGAPHLYLWERGPLKAGDVRDWACFLGRYAERVADEDTLSARIRTALPGAVATEVDRVLADAAGNGYVSGYARTVVTRALNTALRDAVTVPPHAPLPGGHDPLAQNDWIRAVRRELLAEFPGCFASPPTWGGGLSLRLVDALQNAGIDRAWLGAENWLDVLWHPEAAAAAREAGYLLATYDSYGSAHPEDLADTWDTAQMGDEIFEQAAYRNADGSRVTGFANRGVYVNPLAVEDYVKKRIAAVADAGELESYFLDVDATGEDFADYTPGRETSRHEVENALRARLAFVSRTLGLVTGSEGGVAFYAPALHFAHGMTTVPFKWTSAAMRDKADKRHYVGGYWPPEAPDIFFRTTELPAEQQRLFFAPEFRLPLFEIALHDSVVTTHHWEYPSLKFAGERERTELLQLLYMVPPLYQLSAPTLDRDLPTIAAYVRRFAPLHQKLWDLPMTAFRFLSEDRLVQQTEFEGGTTITVNFSGTARKLAGGNAVPPMGVVVSGSAR